MLRVLPQIDPVLTSEKPHILIIDDSVDELRLLLDSLRSQQYRISVAFDGQQGYQRALASVPDLILLDVQMPKVDGYAVGRLIKANPLLEHIPLLFLSAGHSLQERMRGFTVGGADFIAKPFAIEEVLARVAVHLRQLPQALTAREVYPGAAQQDSVLVKAVLRYIRLHACEPVSLAQIAAKVGCHEKKLSKVFKEQLGQTVFAYIREERISNARQLLAQTEMSVIDVAEQAGFQNACNFTTAFRERFNITPSGFRRAIRETRDVMQCF